MAGVLFPCSPQQVEKGEAGPGHIEMNLVINLFVGC